MLTAVIEKSLAAEGQAAREREQHEPAHGTSSERGGRRSDSTTAPRTTVRRVTTASPRAHSTQVHRDAANSEHHATVSLTGRPERGATSAYAGKRERAATVDVG